MDIVRISSTMLKLLLTLASAHVTQASQSSIGDVIDAVNCGGPQHIDSNGVHYRADPLEGRAGVSSDHGKRFLFGRVHPQDQPLYHTERYALDNLEYHIGNIPSEVDGDYVLVMKFSEVWFSRPNEKVFSVVLNEEHTVVKDLDIFARVGKAVAHEEIIPFRVEDGKLRVQDEVSDFHGKLVITLVKSPADNPKLNAYYILKGKPENVPPLPPLDEPEEPDIDPISPHKGKSPDEEDDGLGETPPTPSEFASGPKVTSPYELQDQNSMLMPLLVAVACIVPVVVCLCRL